MCRIPFVLDDVAGDGRGANVKVVGVAFGSVEGDRDGTSTTPVDGEVRAARLGVGLVVEVLALLLETDCMGGGGENGCQE